MSRTIVMQAGVPQEFYELSNFFRILASAGPLSVEFLFGGREVAEAIDVTEGYAEKFETGAFDRVRLVSPTNQTVQFVQRLGNVVQYDKAPVGDSNIVGSVPLALDAATLAALESVDLNAATLQALARDAQRPEAPGGNWQNSIAVAINTPIAIITPAANVNGAILWSAGAQDYNAAATPQNFIAKATAPANFMDGDVLCMSKNSTWNGSFLYKEAELVRPARIAPGLGVYFISAFAGAAAGYRYARFTLL